MLDSHLIVKTRPMAQKENTVLWKEYRVTVLFDRLFRVEKEENGHFCDKATQCVWFRDMVAVPFTKAEADGKLHIKTEKAELVLCDSVEESYIILNKKHIALDNRENLLGTYRTLDQYIGDTFVSTTDGSTHKMQLGNGVLSKNGVAVYDDSASLLLLEDGSVAKRENEETDLYLFAYGHDYREAVRALYAVCGAVPLIPRFALGNWWSRYHAYSDKEYLHLLDRLAARDIPLTVATIDMDWHWSKTLDEKKKITESGKDDEFRGGKNGWTGYSWNTDLFPDYKDTLKKIHDRHLKVTLNLHPSFGIRWFEDMYEDVARAVGVDPKTEERINFNFTSDRFINAYFSLIHKPYEHNGVDFWWIDWQQGTKTALAGLDPLWALNHYHTLDNGKEHEPLILSRYSGVGAHRYPIGFSGDTYVSWKSLAYIPYFTANASNIGYTWWSHDIGGHMRGIKDNELYTRYIQFGVFSPICRLHCSCEELCTKEPCVYVNGIGLVAEEFLRLRHRMIPFLYSADIDTHENGRALIEPMYYEWPEEKAAYAAKNQYMFGSELLVAPITTPTKGKDRIAGTRVWLPEGHWTDIFTGDEYEGGKWVNMYRFTDSIPVLAREGGFFVLDTRKHINTVDTPDDITVMTFNGTGTYTFREGDDGKRADTVFTSVGEEGKQTLTFKESGAEGVIPPRTVRLQFKNIQNGTVTVTANGKKTAAEADSDEFLTVVIPNVKKDVTYTVSVEYTRDERAFRNSRLLWTMQRINTEDLFRTNNIYRYLCKLSSEEGRPEIENEPTLSAMAKKRALEQY